MVTDSGFSRTNALNRSYRLGELETYHTRPPSLPILPSGLTLVYSQPLLVNLQWRRLANRGAPVVEIPNGLGLSRYGQV